MEICKVIINSTKLLEEYIEQIEISNSEIIELSEKPIPIDKKAFEERTNQERIISLNIIEYNTKLQNIHEEVSNRIQEVIDLGIEDVSYTEVTDEPHKSKNNNRTHTSNINIEQVINEVAGMYVHLLTPPSYILDDSRNYTASEKATILKEKIELVCNSKSERESFIAAYSDYKLLNRSVLLEDWLASNYLIGKEKFNV